MAKVILDANETYTVASASTIFGAAGSNETVKVLDGAAVTFGGDVERVEFAGASTAFTYKATTTGVQVLKGTTVVANVVNNQKLAFTDGSATVSVTFDAATASNVVKVGTQTVTATAAAPTFTPNNAAGEASTLTAGSSSTPTTGQSFSLTTGTDTLIGTSGNDTFTGATTTYADADRVIDASTTDTDTYNLTIAANAVPDVTNVEKINVTTAATGGLTIFANKMSGVKELTVTTGDLSVGGSTIAGSKTVTVDKLLADKVAKVVTGAGVKVFTLDQTQATPTDSKAGVEIDATTVTGNITVTGAATLNADNAAAVAGEKVIVKAINGAAAAENAKAVTINAAKALDVEVNDNTAKFTGAITVNAAAAKEVQVQSASGGVTINAAKAADNAGNGIVVAGIDDSGATITTGSFGSLKADGSIDKQGKISVDGSSSSDVATITAAGYIGLITTVTDQVETLNLSGNGAAVQYAITGAATTYTLTGDQSVTLAGDEASFDGKTVTDSTTAGTTAVKITTLNDSDLSKVAVDKIIVASNVANKTLTVANNANIELATDIGTAFSLAGKTVDATVNVSTGDDTNASGATISIETGTFTAATNIATVNLDATVGKFVATSTVLTNSNATGIGATLNVTGSKDVSLGTVTAKAVSAGSSTGKITLVANGADTAKSITTGSGADDITLNQALKFTVDAGNGDNKVTISAADEASSVATGSGADTINLASTAAVVVVTGAGDDTVNVQGANTDAIIAMGDGTADKLVFAAAMDLKAKTNFAVTGVEIVDVTAADGTVKVKATAFAQDNAFRLVGNSATADIFHVLNTSTTAGATIDASGVTFNATQDAALYLEGAAKLADTITGSAKNDMIIASTGADVINGGEGTDTFNAAALAATDIEGTGTGTSTGVVINLGTSAVTNTSILAATGGFTANSITSVDGGKTAYLFGAAASTNSAVQQTLSSIENVVGTAGRDYIVGSANDNVITGGAGGDYINVGVGTDTVTFAANDTLTGALVTGSAVSVVGADVIAGMGIGDIIALYTAATVADGNLASGTTELTVATAGGAALLAGTYDAAAGTFVEAAAFNATTANDYLVQWADGAAIHSIVVVDQTAAIRLVGTAATDIFTIAAA